MGAQNGRLLHGTPKELIGKVEFKQRTSSLESTVRVESKTGRRAIRERNQPPLLSLIDPREIITVFIVLDDWVIQADAFRPPQ